MSFAREPESNLISNRLRSALFPPQPLRKPDARARKAATVAETLLLFFFVSPGWPRQRQGKGLGQKERKTSTAVQEMKGRVKVDVSLLDSCEECKGIRGSDKMVLILDPVNKQEGSLHPVAIGKESLAQ